MLCEIQTGGSIPPVEASIVKKQKTIIQDNLSTQEEEISFSALTLSKKPSARYSTHLVSLAKYMAFSDFNSIGGNKYNRQRLLRLRFGVRLGGDDKAVCLYNRCVFGLGGGEGV